MTELLCGKYRQCGVRIADHIESSAQRMVSLQWFWISGIKYLLWYFSIVLILKLSKNAFRNSILIRTNFSTSVSKEEPMKSLFSKFETGTSGRFSFGRRLISSCQCKLEEHMKRRKKRNNLFACNLVLTVWNSESIPVSLFHHQTKLATKFRITG